MTCPAAIEIVLLAEGRLPSGARERIETHLKECSRCQTLSRTLPTGTVSTGGRAIPEVILRDLQGFEPLPERPSMVRPGQLWLAADVPGILLVVALLENDDAFAALPVSTETAYLADRDVWLSALETPLGSSVMVQTWLSVPVDPAAFGRYLGELSEVVHGAVDRVRMSAGVPGDLSRTGPPINGRSDPRYAFQKRQIEIWRPASLRLHKRMAELDQEQAAASMSLDTILCTLRAQFNGFEIVYDVVKEHGLGGWCFEAKPRQIPESWRSEILPLYMINAPGAYVYQQGKRFEQPIVFTSSAEIATKKGIRIAPPSSVDPSNLIELEPECSGVAD